MEAYKEDGLFLKKLGTFTFEEAIEMKDRGELSLDANLRKNDAVLAYRLLNGHYFVVDLVNGTLNKLNYTATKIWQLIDGKTSLGSVVARINELFEIERKQALDDVAGFISDISLMGWIENSSPSVLKSAKREEGDIGSVFQELREDMVLSKVPLVAHFDLTYRCPLDCVHCYLRGNKGGLELSTEKVKSILSQLAESGTLYLVFSGGEIFLRDDIAAIMDHARKLHFSVRLLTSGIPVNQARVSNIATWHPESVSLSVYDMDSSIHDAITGVEGSLRKTLDAIELLKAEGIHLKISSVIMEQNLAGYEGVRDFAKSIGAQFQLDYRITPRVDGSKDPLRFHIKDSVIADVLEDLTSEEGYELGPDDEYCGVFNSIPCGAGHMSCYISPQGIVTSCVQVSTKCGDLKEKEFLDVWNNSAELQAFRSLRISDISKCGSCRLFPYCRPCPGLNLADMGDLKYPSPRICREAEFMNNLNEKRR